LIGTICWSVYTVLSKPLLEKYTPLKLTALTMTFATPPLVLAAIPSLNIQDWSIVSKTAWMSLAYSSSLAIAIGYVIWYTGVSHIGSARTSLYDNLVTVIAVAFAWVVLSESMTLIQIIGAALVFLSLYIARKNNRKQREST
jgi:drug/metabolite transporter (DMT)-like permease